MTQWFRNREENQMKTLRDVLDLLTENIKPLLFYTNKFPVIANTKCRTNLASKNVTCGIHYQSFLPLRTSFMSSNVIADCSHMPRKIPSDKTKRLVGVSNS